MGTPASPSLDVNLNPDIPPALSPSRGEVGEVLTLPSPSPSPSP